jgi:hypothetical protein
MAGPAIAFNQPGLAQQLPAHLRDVEAALAKADSAGSNSAAAKAAAEHLARDRFFLEQKRGARHTLATLTFTDSLTIRLGRRAIQVLHVDRAITPGDAFASAGREPRGLGRLAHQPDHVRSLRYPDGWIRTLGTSTRWTRHADPGHGAHRDETLLHATLALLRRERALAREAKANGQALQQAKAAALGDPEVLRLRNKIIGGDTKLEGQFGVYLVSWFVSRAYAEADGPLDDSIPSSP